MKLFTLLSMLFFVFAGTSAMAQNDPHEKAIIKMLEVQGTAKLFETSLDAMIDLMRDNYADRVPDEFWDEFMEEIRKDGIDELFKMLVPIYKKHYTLEDVNGIIAFYESETGQKMVEKLPVIQQDSMEAGAEWGRIIGTRVAKKIEEKY